MAQIFHVRHADHASKPGSSPGLRHVGKGGRKPSAPWKKIPPDSVHERPAAHLPGGYNATPPAWRAPCSTPGHPFLDEPTSGADPLARRDFWLRINALAEKGVTIIITTHFLGKRDFAITCSS
ncbi:MAG: hypothetical protein ACLSUW_00665 [Akkermansia sp.]